MLVRVLGDLQVEVVDQLVDLGGPKPRAVVAQLVAAEGRPVPVERLVDQVWGERPPARVEASLQSYVARLRRALEPERDAGHPAARLRTHTGGYSLDLATDEVDARRFAGLVRDGRALAGTDPDRAVELLDQGLRLWRGEAYAGLAGASLQAEATRLAELRMTALTLAWELRLARGEHGEAVAELDQLTRLHPLREQLWALLALALYRDSRQADALAVLRRVRETLADELGVDPGPELRRLEQAILQQDPALVAPVREPRSAAAVPAAAGPAPGQPVPLPTTDPEPGPRLFGRDAALAEAAQVLVEAAAGRGRTVLVSGEPGIGKSRFTEAVAARAESLGFRVGRGGWEPEATPALWGWNRAVAQATGRGDVLSASATDGTDAAAASYRIADALVAVLREGSPTLLVLDDAHWADVASLRLLRRVAAQLSDVPAVLVVALRSAPAEIGEPVADALAALARLQPARVELAGLGPDDVAAWVTEQAGVVVGHDVAAELSGRTDGNPFYVTELVRLLVTEGALSDTSAAAWRSVPGGVRDVVRQRLRSLPEEAVAVLRVAAVAGRSFDHAVVSDVVGDEQAVDEAVESAQVLGLVDEEAPGRYRFTHALARDAVRELLGAPARARAHASVAAALERVHAGRVGEIAAELAEHYRLAGPAYRRSAWVFARQAGRAAAARSGHDEAVRLFSDAARLQTEDPTVEPLEREAVLLGLVRALTRVARPLEAWEPAAEAARSALARHDATAAAVALTSITEGMVWGWRTHPDYDDDAVALWEAVLAVQPDDAVLTRAHLTAAVAAELLYRPGAAARATALADRAIAMVRSTGRRGSAELLVLKLAHMALLRPDQLHRRVGLADEIVALSAEVGEPSDLAGALTGRAQARAELGRMPELRSDVIRAHELAERHHLPQNLLVSGWCLCLLHQLEGDHDGAEQMIGELETFHATLAMSGRGIEVSQIVNLRDLQGRLPELEPQLRAVAPFHPAFRELHALALLRSRRHEELRLLLGPYAEQPELPFDYMWLPFMAVRAEVWSGLGDAEAAADLGRQLTPYADRLAYSAPVAFRGSMRLWLGRLATVAGDAEAARGHLDEARRVHDALGLDPWVRRVDEALDHLAAASR